MFEFWRWKERERVKNPTIDDIYHKMLLAEIRRSRVKNPNKVRWDDASFSIKLKPTVGEIRKRDMKAVKSQYLSMIGVPQEQIDRVESELKKREQERNE